MLIPYRVISADQRKTKGNPVSPSHKKKTYLITIIQISFNTATYLNHFPRKRRPINAHSRSPSYGNKNDPCILSTSFFIVIPAPKSNDIVMIIILFQKKLPPNIQTWTINQRFNPRFPLPNKHPSLNQPLQTPRLSPLISHQPSTIGARCPVRLFNWYLEFNLGSLLGRRSYTFSDSTRKPVIRICTFICTCVCLCTFMCTRVCVCVHVRSHELPCLRRLRSAPRA